MPYKKLELGRYSYVTRHGLFLGTAKILCVLRSLYFSSVLSFYFYTPVFVILFIEIGFILFSFCKNNGYLFYFFLTIAFFFFHYLGNPKRVPDSLFLWYIACQASSHLFSYDHHYDPVATAANDASCNDPAKSSAPDGARQV